jgi:methylenetetrahydrofolate--tRNA-(uracil-5-)-methyltransferase
MEIAPHACPAVCVVLSSLPSVLDGIGVWGLRMEERALIVIGGGLAGSEAAWQAASRGVRVTLFEMRPAQPTPAHATADLAELVCSNSLGSDLPDRAPGLLKQELRRLGSLIMACADATRVPAGSALAVGREAFSRAVTEAIEAHPAITVVRQEITEVPTGVPAVLASGPLTSDRLAASLSDLTGAEHLAFFDAMAPIVAYDSIDMTCAFRASRYGKGEADYVNCPMTREEYDAFVAALLDARTRPLREFEREDPRFFEACLPVEVLAARGPQALAYGPLRPVGLTDPRTGRRPHAVVQLRQDNLAGTLYNLVGFQTNLAWPDQARVFGMIPGLEHAEWVRFGQMHRNTFIHSPSLLEPTGRLRGHEHLYLAGMLIGTEGYVGSTASGLLAGLNAARALAGQEPVALPETTMLGALMRYVSGGGAAVRREPPEDGDSPAVGAATCPPGMADFQPMKPNLGLLPPVAEGLRRNKRARQAALAERSAQDLEAFIAAHRVLDDAEFRTLHRIEGASSD